MADQTADPRPWRPISQAIEASRFDEVEKLADGDPDSIDVVDGTGLTPLAHAVDVLCDSEQQTGKALPIGVVKLLFSAGADPDAGSALGRSARQLATGYRNARVLTLFSTIDPEH